ncbi:hypothetical protein J6590_103035, partial [Homalodisca vitripennis]
EPALGTAKLTYHSCLGNHMVVQEQHITNRKCQYIEVEGWIDIPSLPQRMTVTVGGSPLVLIAVAILNMRECCICSHLMERLDHEAHDRRWILPPALSNQNIRSLRKRKHPTKTDKEFLSSFS